MQGSQVPVPAFDPPAFAGRVMQQLDKDSNNALTKVEAREIPGIVNRWDRYDLDSDGAVSTAELEQRAGRWADRGVSLAIVEGFVRLNGRNIDDVTVKLIPEEVLAEIILPAEAVSKSSLPAYFQVPDELKEPTKTNLRGMQYGLYRVEVSHPTMQLEPAPQSRGVDIGREDEVDPLVLHVQLKK